MFHYGYIKSQTENSNWNYYSKLILDVRTVVSYKQFLSSSHICLII